MDNKNIFLQANAINKMFGCCSKNFWLQQKKNVPNFAAVTKPFLSVRYSIK